MTDYTVGDTFHIAFTTRAFATGTPTVLAGTPVVSAYEDASLTQITAGITLGASHDSVVGLNMLTIVATGANGYEAGKDYHLVITTGTVGGVSVVGEVVGRFTLGRSAAAVDLANATDGLGAIKAETAAILVDTGTTLDTKINTIDTVVDSILLDTAEIGAAGAGLTALATAANLATVDTVVDGIQIDLSNATDGLGAIKTAVDAIPTANPTAAAIADQVWDEAIAGHAIAGSTGEQLAAAGAGGDPWATALPGAYTAGQAGKIVGDNINAPLVTIDTVVDGIQTDLDNATDGLGAIKTSIDGLNNISVADILTTQMTEAYAGDGVAPTLAQALFAILQQAGEFAISGTTITVKKLDGTTTAMTFTLDDATDPTSRTRAT